MAKNLLTTKQRTKWRSLYRAGWRVKFLEYGKWWIVQDEQGRTRSGLHRNRDYAVAEVVGS